MAKRRRPGKLFESTQVGGVGKPKPETDSKLKPDSEKPVSSGGTYIGQGPKPAKPASKTRTMPGTGFKFEGGTVKPLNLGETMPGVGPETELEADAEPHAQEGQGDTMLGPYSPQMSAESRAQVEKAINGDQPEEAQDDTSEAPEAEAPTATPEEEPVEQEAVPASDPSEKELQPPSKKGKVDSPWLKKPTPPTPVVEQPVVEVSTNEAPATDERPAAKSVAADGNGEGVDKLPMKRSFVIAKRAAIFGAIGVAATLGVYSLSNSNETKAPTVKTAVPAATPAQTSTPVKLASSTEKSSTPPASTASASASASAQPAPPVLVNQPVPTPSPMTTGPTGPAIVPTVTTPPPAKPPRPPRKNRGF